MCKCNGKNAGTHMWKLLAIGRVRFIKLQRLKWELQGL